MAGQNKSKWGNLKLNLKNQEKKPESPVYKTILDPNGRLSNDYEVRNPNQVRAEQLSGIAQLNSGGTLSSNTVNAQQLGNYDKVGINSVLGDAQKRLDGINADQRGMDALRERALNKGPSAWANLQTQQQQLGEQTALDQSAKAQSGSMANAMSNLAMRGGVGGGASMRAARQSAQDQALAAQGVRRQGQMDRLGISTADEQMRQQALSQLPGAEIAWLQPQMDKAKMLTGVQMEEQGRKLQADTSNRDALMARDQFNANALMDTGKFNSSQAMDASKFNILNNQDVNKYNIGNDMATKQFNIANNLDASKYNTTTQLQNKQFNMSNLLKGVGDKNAYNIDKYKTDMAGWAAGKTADGMTSGGKK
jgi:hypothetical protein